jgi:hypothetical protein
MPPLMDKIRECCYAANLKIGVWYGGGALAKYALKQHQMEDHLSPTPEQLSLSVRTAYAGGWFERFKAGWHEGPIYTADINSAYAYAMSIMPSLRDAEWEWIDGDAARQATGRFGVFHIHYGESAQRSFDDWMRTCVGVPLPLFQRGKNGNMSRQFRNDGWFWNFEAATVHSSPNYKFAGAWVLCSPGRYERPFEWVANTYDARLDLQKIGDPAEKALKWMLASLYGTMAQRSGWDRRARTAPAWHQLEYAGAITAWCRSMMFRVALPVSLENGLVSIDTDGIISTKPIKRLPITGEGDGLGEWKLEQFSGILYIQNGVYWLRDMQGNWLPPKARGIPRSQIGDVGVALGALESGGRFTVSRRNFIGYGAAIHRRDRSAWRTWEDSEYEIDIRRAGSRQHSPRLCRTCRSGTTSFAESLHDLALTPSFDQLESTPHKLPWLEDNDDPELLERLRRECEDFNVNEELM